MNKNNSVDVWHKQGAIRTCAAAALVILIPAGAKAMDYGSLEQLPAWQRECGPPRIAPFLLRRALLSSGWC
jgi:hypothetical protein